MTHPFDQHYFHGGGKVGGYAGEGYRDFAVHDITAARVLALQPPAFSVLELGCARGYLLKRLEDAGVRVRGLEISEHCRLTRVVEPVITHDITRPWTDVVGDQAFDLCLSVAVLEHIPEDKLPIVLAEMARTCKRGLHGIDVHDDDGFDQTHVTIRPLEWWQARMPLGHVAVDKETLEAGPITRPMSTGLKLNLGSFTTMFAGWRNLDRVDLSRWAAQQGYSFLQWDLRQGLPFDDGVADLVYMSHVLEHFSYDEGGRLLAECRRVLKPGGVVRVLVPDAEVLTKKYLDGSLGDFDELSATASAQDHAGKLYELLCAGHESIYDGTRLERALSDAGFALAERARFRQSRSEVMRRETIDLYPDLSLIAEAIK